MERLMLRMVCLASDVMCLLMGVAVGSLLWPSSGSGHIGGTGIAVAVVIWVMSLLAFGAYGWKGAQLSSEPGRLLAAVACSLSATFLLARSSSFPVPGRGGYVAILSFGFLLMFRRALDVAIQRAQRHGRLCRRALVVGTGAPAVRLERQLRRADLMPVGFVLAHDGHAELHSLPLPIVGHVGNLAEAIRRNDISCVVASPDLDEAERVEVVRAARRNGAEARIASDEGSTSPMGTPVHTVGLGVALALKPFRSAPLQDRMKRAFDVGGALFGLILIAPMLAVVAVAVLVTSGRPVFFRQKRITTGGRPFTLYKFRTMVVGADRMGRNPQANAGTLFFKTSDPALLTPLGGFIRRFSIDELPQLWNVVRGDMSLVGPRPLPASQIEANVGLLARRHDRPTGLTGWWQINGRSDVDADEAIDLDLFYVENWSFAFDIYILLKTVRAVLSKSGAY